MVDLLPVALSAADAVFFRITNAVVPRSVDVTGERIQGPPVRVGDEHRVVITSLSNCGGGVTIMFATRLGYECYGRACRSRRWKWTRRPRSRVYGGPADTIRTVFRPFIDKRTIKFSVFRVFARSVSAETFFFLFFFVRSINDFQNRPPKKTF